MGSHRGRYAGQACPAPALCLSRLRCKAQRLVRFAEGFRTRDLLVRQRTQAINALRGHLAEFGVVVAKGPLHVPKLITIIEDLGSALPETVRVLLCESAPKP